LFKFNVGSRYYGHLQGRTLYLISINFAEEDLKNAVNFNEASMQSKFDNLVYHRLAYAVVNLYNHKHFSSIGIL
jgi:hypothetical protein